MPPAGPRRAVLALAGGGLGAGLAAPALAPSALARGKFPDRPIRLIVPWPPGGSADAQLRSLAELSGRTLGQSVLVENRPGDSGTLGAQFLTGQARPDGYTLAQMHMSIVWRPFIQLRLICVWTAERSPRFPAAPTLKELGYDMVITPPYGISGPKGMDPGVVRVLHDAFRGALMDPANAAVRASFDMPLEYYPPEEYRQFIARRAEYEQGMARRLNLRID